MSAHGARATRAALGTDWPRLARRIGLAAAGFAIVLACVTVAVRGRHHGDASEAGPVSVGSALPGPAGTPAPGTGHQSASAERQSAVPTPALITGPEMANDVTIGQLATATLLPPSLSLALSEENPRASITPPPEPRPLGGDARAPSAPTAPSDLGAPGVAEPAPQADVPRAEFVAPPRPVVRSCPDLPLLPDPGY